VSGFIEPLHPYGWLGEKRAKTFADFLELKLNDPQVKEVVILGDLFDDWVDGEKSTFVETQIDEEEGRHYVRLWQYHEAKADQLLGERFIEV